MPINRRFALRQRPVRRIDDGTFELVEEDLPELGDREALIRTEWISLDPTNRTWIEDMPGYLPPVQIGETMRALGLGRVVESKHPDYEEGQLVQGLTGWTENFIASDAAPLQRVPEIEGVSPSLYLGALGMTGLTAWVGMKEIGKPKEGETVVVSAAAGAVGSVAGQLAKRDGARVVGIAGGPEKGSILTERARLRRSRRPQAPRTGASSSRPQPRTASTSTSRTSAARSWTRSSPASTSTPGSPSAG